jgi:ABC-type antimicrobial peptide transport system permease subunit
MLLLALLGIGLSVQGVYAFAAGTVTERTHDLAVRSALGASQGRLIWNVTGELVLSVLAGSVCGVAAVFELQPLLGRLIGTTGEWQTQPIVIAVLLLALAAAAGCYFPARAAMRANPIEALRQS